MRYGLLCFALFWMTAAAQDSDSRVRLHVQAGLDQIDSLAVSRDGTLALTGSLNEPAARLWHLPTGRELRRLEGHDLRVLSVAFSPDGRKALTTDYQGVAQEPTKQNLRAAFEAVEREAKPDDVLLVYLAGHAIALRGEQDQYYYLTREARGVDIDRDAGLRAAHAVSSSELKEWLSRENMPLKQVLVLIHARPGLLSASR
jgi:WD40 repeat protein